MSDLRVVSFDGLRERLAQELGEDNLLYRRFEQALTQRDPDLVAAAMDSLALYPEAMRNQVQNALLAWLFNPSDNSGLAALPAASSAKH